MAPEYRRTRTRSEARITGRLVPLALASLAVGLLAIGTARAQDIERTDHELLAALEQGLRPTMLEVGEPLPGWSLRERMEYHRVPGVAIAVIEDGEVAHAIGVGVRSTGSGEPVDADTLFNVGSISKVVTAATTLRLVAQDRLTLDRDVNDYLHSWHLPSAPGNAPAPVTLRMLMSHTAGLNVHGFADFEPGEALPSLLDTLDGRAPAKNPPVRRQRLPGLFGDYSGGGTVVEQLVLEDAAGQPLEAIARREVFAPIGMRRSTFSTPVPDRHRNIAGAHDEDGAPTAQPRGWESFPQSAAAGLWTSANELGAFVGALIRSYRGDAAFLPQSLAVQMMTEVAPSWHGLGPRMDGAGLTRIFHHGGSNDSYHAWIEGYLATGDGFVILTNGANGWALRTEIRNALSDALGHGVNPPVRTVALAPGAVSLKDYAGVYCADPTVPLDQRRALTDFFAFDILEIRFADDRLSVVLPDETGPLSPLSPSQFVAGTVFGTQYRFHRDAHGVVRGLTVEHGASRAYYRHEPERTQVTGSCGGEAAAEHP